MYHCSSFLVTSNSLGNIPNKEYIALLLALDLLKSRTEAITRVLKIVTYAAVEKGMENKEEQR